MLLAAGVGVTTALSAAAAGAAPTVSTHAAAGNVWAVYTTPYTNTVEPSIGVDRRTGTVLFTDGGGTRTARFNDATRPAAVRYGDAAAISTAPTSLDPIGFVDPVTGRVFDSELAGACSFTSFSDTDGVTASRSVGCGVNTLLDHQTLGGGPYHAGGVSLRTSSYPDAVYYCAQDGVTTTCARSDDGGTSFGPGVETGFVAARCSALTGHLKVAPDGTVAVPNKDCGGSASTQQLTDGLYDSGHPGVAISSDNGVTWQVSTVPSGYSQDEDDPSVAWSRNSVLYLAWQDGRNVSAAVGGSTSSVKVARSTDHGATWSTPVDVSTPLGLHNVHFPEIVAGDDNRVAVQWVGTRAVGDDQHTAFRGTWDQYMSTSYDGGRTWATVDLTPGDPVMRNCVDNQGTKPGASNNPPVGSTICTQRQLYDFQDLSLDRSGRPVGVFTDGCTGTCDTATAAPRSEVGMLVRLQSGRGLYAASDASVGTVVAPAAVPRPAPAAAGATVRTVGATSAAGRLATTGLAPRLGVAGAVCVGLALAVRRRARRS